MKKYFLIVILSILFVSVANAANLMHSATKTKTITQSVVRPNSDNAILQKFAHSNVLYFFYDSNCPNCQAFAPILRKFVDQYKIKVVAVTFDSISLPEFPHSRGNIAADEKFNVEYTPTLFAVNSKTHKTRLITDGLISYGELKDRITGLAK